MSGVYEEVKSAIAFGISISTKEKSKFRKSIADFTTSNVAIAAAALKGYPCRPRGGWSSDVIPRDAAHHATLKA